MYICNCQISLPMFVLVVILWQTIWSLLVFVDMYFPNWQTSWALFVCMDICASIIGRQVRHSCIFLACGFSILDRLFWLLFTFVAMCTIIMSRSIWQCLYLCVPSYLADHFCICLYLQPYVLFRISRSVSKCSYLWALLVFVTMCNIVIGRPVRQCLYL